MNSKHSKTGYGLYDNARRVARRMKRIIDETEYTDRPFTRAAEPALPPADSQRTEKRPLAA